MKMVKKLEVIQKFTQIFILISVVKLFFVIPIKPQNEINVYFITIGIGIVTYIIISLLMGYIYNKENR